MGVEMSNSIRYGRHKGWVNSATGGDLLWLVVDGDQVICGFFSLRDAASFCNFLNGGAAVSSDVLVGWRSRVIVDMDLV